MNVLVTGASSGIGAATAIAFARAATPWASAPAGRIAWPRCSPTLPGGRSWVVDLADLDGIDAFAATADDGAAAASTCWSTTPACPKRRRDHDHDRRRRRGRDGDELLLARAPHPRAAPADDRARPRRHRERVVDGCAPRGVRRRCLLGVEGGARAVHRVALRGAPGHRCARAPRRARHHRHRVQHAEGRQRPAASRRARPRRRPRRWRPRSSRASSSDQFVSYATARDAATSATKAADPNAFLAEMREALAGLRRN